MAGLALAIWLHKKHQKAQLPCLGGCTKDSSRMRAAEPCQRVWGTDKKNDGAMLVQFVSWFVSLSCLLLFMLFCVFIYLVLSCLVFFCFALFCFVCLFVCLFVGCLSLPAFFNETISYGRIFLCSWFLVNSLSSWTALGKLPTLVVLCEKKIVCKMPWSIVAFALRWCHRGQVSPDCPSSWRWCTLAAEKSDERDRNPCGNHETIWHWLSACRWLDFADFTDFCASRHLGLCCPCLREAVYSML